MPKEETISQNQQQGQQIVQLLSIQSIHVQNGWKKYNPKGNQTIPIKQLEQFIKYVLQESKDQLELELQDDTDYMQMIQGYLQATQQPDKKQLSLEEALQLMNWALAGDQQEQQEEQQGKNTLMENGKVEESKQVKSKQVKSKQVKSKQVKSKEQTKQDESEVKKTEDQQNNKDAQIKPKRNSIRKSLKHQRPSLLQQKQKLKLAEKINQQKHQQDSKQKTNQQQKQQQIINAKSINEGSSKNITNSQIIDHQNDDQEEKQLSQQKQQDQQWDWTSKQHHQKNNVDQRKSNTGSVERNEFIASLDGKKKSLTKNSRLFTHDQNPDMNIRNEIQMELKMLETQNQQQQNDMQMDEQPAEYIYPKKQQNQVKKLQPLKSARLKKKVKPPTLITPSSNQIKYITRARRIIKHKPKPKYIPQNGVKQVYKFYCMLNSQFQKGKPKHCVSTFDDIQSRNSQLYMHNFMLFCKDFYILKDGLTKSIGSSTIKKNGLRKTNKNDNQKDEKGSQIRSRKGSVPSSQFQDNINTEQKTLNSKLDLSQIQDKLKSSRHTQNVSSNWDRVTISTLFKKQADYNLNVQYEKFIKLLTVLYEKQIQEIKDQMNQEQKPINNPKQQLKSIINDKANQEQQQNDDVSQKHKQKQQSGDNNKSQSKIKQQQKTKILQQPFDQTIALAKCLKVYQQTQYEQTIKRLKIIYKMLQKDDTTATTSRKNQIDTAKTDKPQALTGLVEERVHLKIKEHKLQKQNKQIQKAQKYLQKFATSHTDPIIVARRLQSKVPSVYEPTYNISMLKKTKKDHFNVNNVIKGAREESQMNKQNIQHLDGKTSKIGNKKKVNILLPKSMDTQIIGKNEQMIGYKKINELKGDKTDRAKSSMKKTVQSPLLLRIGCGQQDNLLDAYFEQQDSLDIDA